MVILAKVKGYINGNERGVHEPTPELMTAQEIVAAATSEGYPWTNLISDLNEYAEDYYNICHDAHLYIITYSSINKCLFETGTYRTSSSGTDYISYNTNTKIRSIYTHQGTPK